MFVTFSDIYCVYIPGKPRICFSLVLCSLWWVQIVGYVLACRSYSFVCTLHHLIIIQSQSQRFLLQQNKYHTYMNIRDWNPFGFTCLLKYIHYSYRAWPHFGDNRVSTGASTEAKRSPKGTGRPPQDALEFSCWKPPAQSMTARPTPRWQPISSA